MSVSSREALTLADKDKIIKDVYANTSNTRNYDCVFIKDDDLQVQQSHHYLPERQEPTSRG